MDEFSAREVQCGVISKDFDDFEESIITLNSNFVADGNYAWEWWYKFQVTDNISITPAIFWIENGGFDYSARTVDDSFGAVLKTTFKF